VWAEPRPPTAAIGAARSLGLNTATLVGTVNPQGEATTYYFDYGTTPAYGQRTPTRQAGFGNGTVPVTAALSGLPPATSYHFRLVAHSSAGTLVTPDATFTTQGYYQNPLFSTAAMPDPFVLDNGGTHSDYWAYGTGDRFPMLHSDDLVHWTAEGPAMATRPSWVVSAADWNPWAPSVLPSSQPCPGTTSNGCYIMYYVGLSATQGVHCIGVAISPTPAGPFVDQGPLDLASGATPGLPLGCGDATSRGNIDPSPFVDASGQIYLYVSTDNVCPGAGPCSFRPTISVIPLSPDGLTASGARVPLFSGDPGTWEAANLSTPTVEGPSLELHNGTYYLFYSGGNWRAAYGMGYATSSSPTGPFTKSPANPILTQTATVIGPGGGDRPVIGPHGGEWLVYHGRSAQDSIPRTLRLDPLIWAPSAGGPDRPVIGGPTSTPQPNQP
jgi:beta-xylosidase